MKLALSGRLFESAQGYRLNRDEFLAFAKETGYDGVELRYPQMPMETPAEEVARVKARLSELGLTWVFGTVEGIHEPALFERSLTTMRQHKAGGALFTRFSAFKPEQIPLAQRFADEARSIGPANGLLMQLHAGTIVDNVPHTLEAMRRLARANVGLAFEPNHLLFDGDARYVEAVAALAPHIAAVSIQNYKAAPPGAKPEEVATINGRPFVRALPGDPTGVDFRGVFRALKKIGFDGWVTVMSDCPPGMDPKGLSRHYFDVLKPLV